jgi:hypothetical protein
MPYPLFEHHTMKTYSGYQSGRAEGNRENRQIWTRDLPNAKQERQILRRDVRLVRLRPLFGHQFREKDQGSWVLKPLLNKQLITSLLFRNVSRIR